MAYVSKPTRFACISVFPFPLHVPYTYIYKHNISLSRRRRVEEAAGAKSGGGSKAKSERRGEKHLLRTSVNTRCSVYFRTTSRVSCRIRITHRPVHCHITQDCLALLYRSRVYDRGCEGSTFRFSHLICSHLDRKPTISFGKRSCYLIK